MTREKREQISNRLIINFAFLLLGSLAMLYVRNFLYSNYAIVTYTVILIIGILAAIGSLMLFVLGKNKFPKIKNYSAVLLGVFLVALLLYPAKFSPFGIYTKDISIITVFALMVIYFIVFAIYTAIMLKKPIEKEKPKKKKK